jgi:hypothetical protein
MANIPTIIVNDQSESEPVYPNRTGGKPVLVIGDAGFTKDTGKIYTFNNYNQARQDHSTSEGIGPEPADLTDNPLLLAVKDVFSEGGIRSFNDEGGVDTVYAINVGAAATVTDYEAAIATSETIEGEMIECYVGLTDTDIIEAILTHLNAMELTGNDRTAVFTAPAQSTKEVLLLITSSGEGGAAIRNSKAAFHTNPNMQATLAAKIARTPYYLDPSLGKYRSRNNSDLQFWNKEDLDDIIGAGLIADWIGPDGIEPCMAVSTGYAEVNGERRVDGLLHHKLNVNHQTAELIKIVKRFVKKNNTLTARENAEQGCISHLENEKLNERLEDYVFSLEAPDAYTLKIIADFRPIGATYYINVTRTVKAPTGTMGEAG